MHASQHKKNILFSTFTLLLCLFSIVLFAQTRQDLTQKRQALIKEIDRAAKLLSTTKKDKSSDLPYLYCDIRIYL